MSKFLGIDIGGTNISYAVINEDSEYTVEGSVETASIASAEELADLIHKDVKSDLKSGLEGIGIGAPSINNDTRQIEFAPNLNWGEIIPIHEIFTTKFDLNGLAVINGDDFTVQALQRPQGVAMRTFWTDSGLVTSSGEIVFGENGLAGEIGHTMTQMDGRECGCGKLGCLEAYIGKDGIIRTAKELLEFSSGGSILQKLSPSDISPEEIFKSARREDPVSLEVVDSVCKHLAVAISNLLHILDLNYIFLSGGISKNGNILKRKTDKYLKSFVLPNLRDKLELKISDLNERNGAILGAAGLAKRQFETVR